MKQRKKRSWLIPVAIVCVLLFFAAVGAIVGVSRHNSRNASYIYTSDSRVIEDSADQGIGRVRVSTLSVPEGVIVTRASYTSSGSVVFDYVKDGTEGIAVMKDDGSGFRSLITGAKGQRILPFADNRRVLLGSEVLECPEGTSLDTCPENAAQIVKIVFPEEFTEDKRVNDIWTEVIIAPDNEHFAWTMLRTDCGAAVAVGELVRTDKGYEVRNAVLASRMNIYRADPENPGYLLRDEVRGGEVKQFVRGGAAISLVGANGSGVAQSVLLDIATGDYTMVTNTPSYDETTIFSPDERFGMTMSTRFSESTDLRVLGIVPRPLGDVMQNMTSTIYMYGVTGVRSEREGNIGPVLIDIERSMTEEDYRGICLADPEGNWVFASPMSWNNDSTRAMWMERQREGGGVRVQIAELLDVQPGEPVSVVSTPDVGDYADTDSKVEDVEGWLAGAHSGRAYLTRKSGFLGSKTVEIVYENYSDDGELFYNGREYSSGGILTGMRYEAALTVTDAAGAEVGSLEAGLRFGAAYKLTSAFTGSTSPQLDVQNSSASAIWKDESATGENLVP